MSDNGLPEGWSREQLERTVKLNPESFNPENHGEETFSYLALSNVSDGRIQEVQEVPCEDAPSRARRRVREGDVLIGTVRPPQRSHAIVPPELDGAVCSTGFCVVRCGDGINPRYVLEYVLSHDFFTQMMGFVAGSGYPAVKNSDVGLMKTTNPPLPEQRKIASVLYTVDQAIQQTEAIIEQTERVKQGVEKKILREGLNHDEYQEVKVPMLPEKWRIPKNWNLTFMEDLTTKITDGAHQTPTYVSEGVPFLKVEDIKESTIDWEDVSRIPQEEHEKLTSRSNPQKGDILLSKNGTIGITKVVDWEREFSHFVSLCLIRPDEEKILTEYVAAILESPICMHQAKVRSKKNTVTNLHLEEIRRFSVPVPPKDEQKKIIAIIDSLQSSVDSEKRRKLQLERLKKGLMQDLLTGAVRTKDRDIPVVDAVQEVEAT